MLSAHTGIKAMLDFLFLLADVLHCAAQVHSVKLGCMLRYLPLYVLQIQLQYNQS